MIFFNLKLTHLVYKISREQLKHKLLETAKAIDSNQIMQFISLLNKITNFKPLAHIDYKKS